MPVRADRRCLWPHMLPPFRDQMDLIPERVLLATHFSRPCRHWISSDPDASSHLAAMSVNFALISDMVRRRLGGRATHDTDAGPRR
jgi:hypothetical protein